MNQSERRHFVCVMVSMGLLCPLVGQGLRLSLSCPVPTLGAQRPHSLSVQGSVRAPRTIVCGNEWGEYLAPGLQSSFHSLHGPQPWKSVYIIFLKRYFSLPRVVYSEIFYSIFVMPMDRCHGPLRGLSQHGNIGWDHRSSRQDPVRSWQERAPWTRVTPTGAHTSRGSR